jgi:hypothetical protein
MTTKGGRAEELPDLPALAQIGGSQPQGTVLALLEDPEALVLEAPGE